MIFLQTLEELPLDYEVPTTRSSGLTDATGLPPFTGNGNLHGLGSQSPSAAYMGSPKSSKSRRAFLSGEQPSPLNNSFTQIPNGGFEDVGVAYPSIFA